MYTFTPVYLKNYEVGKSEKPAVVPRLELPVFLTTELRTTIVQPPALHNSEFLGKCSAWAQYSIYEQSCRVWCIKALIAYFGGSKKFMWKVGWECPCVEAKSNFSAESISNVVCIAHNQNIQNPLHEFIGMVVITTRGVYLVSALVQKLCYLVMWTWLPNAASMYLAEHE